MKSSLSMVKCLAEMNSSLSKKQRQISSPDEEKKKGRVNTSSRDEILK